MSVFCGATTLSDENQKITETMFIKPDDPNDEADTVPMPGGFPSEPGPSTPINPLGSWGIPRSSVFRVGFAGRGRGWPHGNSGR